MQALLDVGVSGFFYCTEHARNGWSEAAFDLFERRFDLRALDGVKAGSMFNILHVCGQSGLRMDWVLDYPVHALNWDDRQPLTPSLAQVRAQTDKVLIGGLDRKHDLAGTDKCAIRARLTEHIRDARAQAGEKLILSGGCDWSLEDAANFPLWREVMESLSANFPA